MNTVGFWLACELAPGGASTGQTFGAKRRANIRREAPGNRSLHASSQIAAAAHAEIILLTVTSEVKTQNQRTNYVTLESLVRAPRFAEKLQKSYVWLKSRHAKARTITVDVAGCL